MNTRIPAKANGKRQSMVIFSRDVLMHRYRWYRYVFMVSVSAVFRPILPILLGCSFGSRSVVPKLSYLTPPFYSQQIRSHYPPTPFFCGSYEKILYIYLPICEICEDNQLNGNRAGDSAIVILCMYVVTYICSLNDSLTCAPQVWEPPL